MSRTWPKQGAALLVFAFAVCVVRAGSSSQAIYELAGRVHGASGKAVVYVALWQANGFLERPVRQLRVAAGAAPDFHFQVSAGHWAVSAFEDRNGNGVLDMGVFGPKEPSGFWRPFTAWRKPRFDDVASLIDRDTRNADIRLK